MIEEGSAQTGSSSAGGDQSHEQSPLSPPPMMSPISPLPNTPLLTPYYYCIAYCLKQPYIGMRCKYDTVIQDRTCFKFTQ